MDLVWVVPVDYESAGSAFVVVQTENLIYTLSKCLVDEKDSLKRCFWD